MGRPSEAEAELRAALAIRQKLTEDNPADIVFRDFLSESCSRLVALLRQAGRLSQAAGRLSASESAPVVAGATIDAS